jgi:hypothetical protein
LPDLLTEAFNGSFDVFFVLAGIEQYGFQSCSFAFENVLVCILDIHDLFENVHPVGEVVLIFWVQILVVQVVEYFDENLQYFHLVNIVLVLLDSRKNIVSQS